MSTIGRHCATCTGPREAIEAALLDGDTISSVSSTYGVSRTSLRRHLQHHMMIDADAASAAGLDGVTIAARVLDVAERARILADDALDAGEVQAAIRAGDAEVRALGALASMGVRHEDPVSEVAMFKTITSAALRASKSDPAVGEALAAELDRTDQTALARDIRAHVHEIEK